MIKLELTPAEADQLAKAIDTAIKQGGIPAAVALVPLFLKLKTASAMQEKDRVDADKITPTNFPRPSP